MQKIKKPFFKNLRSLMAENGINQKFLSEYLGISERNLSHKINGKADFKMSEMLKIVELLNDKNTREFQLTMDYVFFAQ